MTRAGKPTKKASPKDRSSDRELDKLVSDVLTLMRKESGFLGLTRKPQLEADLVAFRIGERIEEYVAKLKESKQKGAVKQVADRCGVTKQTIYNYIYLRKGAFFPDFIQMFRLPRKYFQALGSAINPGRDFISALVMRNLMDIPVLVDPSEPGEPDEQMIKDIGKLLKYSLRVIREDSLADLESIDLKGRVKPWAIEYDFGKAPEDKVKLACEEIERLFQNIESYTRIVNRFDHVRDQMYVRVAGKKPFSQRMLKLYPVPKAKHLPSTANGILYVRSKDRDVALGLAQETPDIAKTTKAKLHFGRSQDVLKDTEKFPPRCIDAVVTDPPYSRKVYGHAWRDYSFVEHDAEDTPEKQAKKIAQVAKIILRRKINKERFAWYSFVPLNYLHVFAPPLLEAFKGTGFQYQLLIWDKINGPKIGNHTLYTHQVEGIIYITLNRAICRQDIHGKFRGFPSPVFTCPAKTTKTQLAWKPPELIQMLVHNATDGANQSEKAQKQVVLDVFAGRASTGVACLRCHRDYRLIESNRKQFRIARAELARELAKKNA